MTFMELHRSTLQVVIGFDKFRPGCMDVFDGETERTGRPGVFGGDVVGCEGWGCVNGMGYKRWVINGWMYGMM